MTKLDIASGICEGCGMYTIPNNLYVDIVYKCYSLVCPVCFYRHNGRDSTEYYNEIKQVIPNIYPEKEYEKHKKDVIAIGDAIVMAGEITDATLKKEIGNSFAKTYFQGTKLSNKFKYLSTKYAFQVQETIEGEKVQLLMLKAVVQFKSYLEFLEHELYKKFREDCKTIFD